MRIIRIFHGYFPHVSLGLWRIILAFCVSVFLLTWLSGRGQQSGRRFWRAASLTALLGYIFFLLSALVLTRGVRNRGMYYFPPFHSYRIIVFNAKKRLESICMNAFNCFLFMPLGFFYGLWRRMEQPQKQVSLSHATALGFVCSLILETLQYCTRRGYFEFDDLLHNTLGAFLGALLFRGLFRNRQSSSSDGK